MKNVIKSTILAGVVSAVSLTSYAQDAVNNAAQAPEQAPACQPVCPAKKALENLSVSLTTGFESEYNFRGEKLTGHSWQTELMLSYAATENLSVYAGAWNETPFHGKQLTNELDLIAGVTYDIEGFTFDLGYTYYWYLEGDKLGGGFDATNEVKFGVSYDTSVLFEDVSDILADLSITPSVYYYYDFDQDGHTVEAAISARIPVSKWIMGEEKDFLGIETSVYYGWAQHARNKADGVVYHQAGSYSYVGANSNLVWDITKNFGAYVGVRWAANSKGQGDDQNVWMGAGCKLGF